MVSVDIYFRLDEYEYYCTDNSLLEDVTWERVLKEIEQIEKRCTVLSVTRTDVI